ncbi:S8 family serine peptidase [Nonomuraea sp. K274]|uniref:S8 family serine peptidase n=1 Tax=Nonomuraea cypriaca TaxID=1187855 RepID=A0A931AD31_9ACTN|nr:S8 family serine peptidase [Nonomuraea cypriaca]MBF8187964.1 S8 family serine peptidase [Nonomuraea cypriaca]
MPLNPHAGRLAGALALALAATVLTVPAAAHAEARDPAPSRETEITLITGDRVHYVDGPGDQDTVTVDRPADAQGGVRIQQSGGDLYVLPDEAMPLIAAERLDKRLFDLTVLTEMGYEGAPPVIVTYEGAAPRAALRGSQVVRPLASVNGAALKIEADPRPFWDSIAAQTAARSGGVAKVWLDGKVKASLKESVPQVGAPQAWAAGYDGSGVEVAVLDTGVDDTHPDLKDQITESVSFVPGQEVRDGNGHGTHVASTIAGTGAASGGANKGVAPGADLLVGKVLGDDGFGQDSWVIAGMEWAAAKAEVVSMSLGSNLPDGGEDPMALAVNNLTEQHDTLFVIAAGNSYNAGTIGAPGSAASALTVGAVNKSDQRAGFSSMGPLYLTNGLKPDISAPGVSINAANSSYSGQSGPYRSMNGTSMATPHVAGAAAVLAQRHPDWSGPALKDALMSSAKALPYAPFQHGTGRLDVAAAVTATVTATGSVPTAFYDWPHAADDAKTTRTITYRNHGDAEVALDLAVAGSDAATLSTPELTVPANGTAEVTLTIDPAALAPNTTVSGLVTATHAGGAVRTAYGAVKEQELYNLTLKLRDRNGEPASGRVVLAGFDGSMVPYDLDGERTLRLRPSTYVAYALLDVEGERPDALGVALLVDPETELDQDTEIVLDASRARKLSVTTPKGGERRQVHLDFSRTVPDGDLIRLAYVAPVAYDDVYVTPTEKVTEGSFDYLTRWRIGEPMLTLDAPGSPELTATPQSGGTLTDGRTKLATVAVGKGAAQDYAGVDVKGKAVIVTRSAEVPARERAAQAVAAGAKLLVVVNDRPGRGNESYGTELPIPVALVPRDSGAALVGKQIEVTQKNHPSYLYDVVDLREGGVPDRDLSYRPRDLAQVRGVYRGPASGGQDGGGFRYNLQDGWGPAIGFQEREYFPAERTEWVTTGSGYNWYETHTIGGDDDWSMRQTKRTYRPGQRITHEWFAPVVRPRLSPDYWNSFRTNSGGIQLNFPPLSDGTPSHSGSGGDSFETMSIALYQGDTLIKRAPSHSTTVFSGLPDEAVPYRVTLDVNRDPQRWSTSTRTHTEWGFVSAKPPEGSPYQTVIPIMQLDYDVKVHGPIATIGLSGTTQEWLKSPSKAVRATLSVSYDDGRTWKPAPLLPTGKGKWTTAVRSGSLSLKATASDTKGNTVSQEIIRAIAG